MRSIQSKGYFLTAKGYDDHASGFPALGPKFLQTQGVESIGSFLDQTGPSHLSSELATFWKTPSRL